MKRIFVSLILGILVTFGLFWLMQFMVMSKPMTLKTVKNNIITDFIRLKREEIHQVEERKIRKKPPPKKRPPPPKMQMQRNRIQPTTQPNLDMPNLDIPLSKSPFNASLVNGISVSGASPSGTTEGTGSAISMDIIPLVRIPPRYPMRAANRRIEGHVIVEFTITKTGTVSDAIVIESKPSRIFNRAALDAIRKWKFKPKIIDGRAVEQRARQTLQFKLSK